jgi:hypothetical protein
VPPLPFNRKHACRKKKNLEDRRGLTFNCPGMGLNVILGRAGSWKSLPNWLSSVQVSTIASWQSWASSFLDTLQRQNAENLKQIFPEKEYRGLSPNFHIHVSVSELYIPTMVLPVLLEEICRLILGIYIIAQRHMNVEIGAEAALFPEKEYINGIAVTVHTV